MKVLIVGNGGREHALAWKFAQSTRLNGLFVANGNGGTSPIAQNINDVSITDGPALVKAARDRDVNLVFVGPEIPLEAGVIDAFNAAGIPAIGPHQKAAQLESSKAFTKAILHKHGIPTAASHTFTEAKAFTDFIDASSGMWVVKKSGLAAGKGVLESDDKAELKSFGLGFIDSDSLVVEEYLKGFEVSIFGLSDGKSWKILPPATDYKKAGDGNIGPNTGGMGAISPVPWLEKSMLQRIETELVAPVYQALEREGLSYKGLLYFGLMITEQGPKILEFNVRFGDPEAQVVIPRIKNDFCSLFEAIANGELHTIDLEVDERTALGVVMAAPGYPGDYPKDIPVEILFTNHDTNRILYHSGTGNDGKKIFTNGGRCFTCVGLGRDIQQARSYAYSLTDEVKFQGSWFRKDIGTNIYNFP